MFRYKRHGLTLDGLNVIRVKSESRLNSVEYV